jgi:hypothetical protein
MPIGCYCKICKGSGWVCENHQDVEWGDGDKCCGGAGMPCECNHIHSKNTRLKPKRAFKNKR